MDALLEPKKAVLCFWIDVEQRTLYLRRRCEDAGQAVVIARADGIELMIVASRASYREAEQAPRYSVHALVPVIGGECQQHVSRQPRVLVGHGPDSQVAQRAPVAARNTRHLVRREL